ncbi:conserved hypothetical protein [Desulfamplus magnetovallimortis]|uniref:Abasic site processing protein n=1 Tax=Desulfamplus magnetovallimortis TaxID=1246637 RepID=A0A1W1HEV9_9BACT|nr:SOS response-associated peptidase [Desulfamplus magnetovallimortis]SLM30938.1 conserved hypothetical protein [Desulfamplus magnetovallimortis]
MCGRFAQESPLEEVERHFSIDHITCELIPRKDLYPSEGIPVIIMYKSETRLGLLHWGLIPRWSKIKPKRPLINARVETLSGKPSFRESFLYRRCLVISNGYYEWKKISETDSRKTKFLFQLPSKEPFAFAGLWDTWNKTHHSCTIITKDAVNSIKKIHNRMPIILEPKFYKEWLDPSNNNVERLQNILTEHAVEELLCQAISDA